MGDLTPGTVHLDHLQTPKLLTNSAQATVWSQTQEVFGKMTVTGSVVFNLRFPGQYFDGETGLHYNYFRDYDPSLGRYVQSDPIGLGGGANLYLYGYANPAIYIDPNGLIVCRLLGLIPEGREINIGAGLGAILGAGFEYTLASTGISVSVQAGFGGGAATYATYGATSTVGGGGAGIGNTGIHAGSYLGIAGGRGLGGSTSLKFGSDGVSTSSGLGLGLGQFGIAEGFYVGREFWECEEEDECED